MVSNYCKDCEGYFSGGESLEDGRCPTCAAIFKSHQEPVEAEEPPADEEGREESE